MGSRTSGYFSNLQNEKINIVPDDVTQRHVSSFEWYAKKISVLDTIVK